MKIEKVLEGARCCFIEEDCLRCPYHGKFACRAKFEEDICATFTDIVKENRLLKEENDQLNSENEWLRAYLNQPYRLRQALELYMESQNPQTNCRG